MRNKNRVLTVSIAGLMTLASNPSIAQSLLRTVETAITEGQVNLDMRFRHETVEQNNALADAAASTLRTRLTLQSAQIRGFSALFEVDNVTTTGADHYDSFITDEYRGTHSVIADPVGTEMNQAYLQYDVNEHISGRLGTQRILHASQRFIGGVGWRQNEQTFDAFTGSYRQDRFTLDYSYVWNVNRIFNSSKPSAQLTDLNSNSYLLLASSVESWGTMSGYVYALDFDNAAALSSLTYGLSWSGELGSVGLNAAIARQTNHGDNPVAYDSHYYSADAALPAGPVTFGVGIEVLGSDEGRTAFATPLATLHKWQGWTDLFLGTPDAGISDYFISLSGNAGKLSLAVTWHDFQSDKGSMDYGSEWDLQANYPINDFVSAMIKFASYDSDGFAVDTDKIWIVLNMVF